MLSVGSSVLAWRWLITIESVSGSIRVSIELVTIGMRSGVQSICVLPHRLAILPQRRRIHVSPPASRLLMMSSYLM